MYKIAIVGFGSLGYRYFEAINRIQLPDIKLFIVDKKIVINGAQTSDNFDLIFQKISNNIH